jgi:hypothetical protein
VQVAGAYCQYALFCLLVKLFKIQLTRLRSFTYKPIAGSFWWVAFERRVKITLNGRESSIADNICFLFTLCSLDADGDSDYSLRSQLREGASRSCLRGEPMGFLQVCRALIPVLSFSFSQNSQDRTLYQGPELYTICFFRSPRRQATTSECHCSTMAAARMRRRTMARTGTSLSLELAQRQLLQVGGDVEGVWRVYVYAQEVNRTAPGTAPVVAAQTVGGSFFASALDIKFDPNLPCPLKGRPLLRSYDIDFLAERGKGGTVPVFCGRRKSQLLTKQSP